MSKTIRLTDAIAVEFQDTVAIPIQESGLYLYNWGTNGQILNNDSFKYNNRNISYAPDNNGVILRTTPQPFVPESQHQANSIVDVAPGVTLTYQRCRIHYASGFKYGEHLFGLAINVSVLCDNNRRVRLAALFDAKDSTKMTINQRQVVLDNVVFNQGWDFWILDINSLYSSNDEQIIALRNKIFGNDVKNISSYQIEFAYVDKAEATEFTTDYGIFTRLQPAQKYVQYWSGQVLDDEIVSKIAIDKNVITVSMVHNRLDLKQYLQRLCNNNGDGFSIEHLLQYTVYDVNGKELGAEAISIKSPDNVFNEINICPYISRSVFENTPDHVNIEVRSTFTDNETGIQITRYAQKVTENLQLFKRTYISLDVDTVKLYENKNVEIQKVTVKRDIPTVIEVPHNYYMNFVTGDEIVLTPFNNTIAFDFVEPISEALYLCIGSNKYVQMTRTADVPATRIIFNVPAAEYYRDNDTYYVVNGKDQCVSYGKVKKN